MAKIFFSYSRKSLIVAKALVEDVKGLGHEVWFDEELSGGQLWWDQILSRIRASDVFLLVLDPEVLRSTACTREMSYASALRKPIVPTLVATVSYHLLPPELSAIQIVDYTTQDRRAALRLARAITAVRPAEPLPDPLPAAPEAPMSFLAELSEMVGTPGVLRDDQQLNLVVELRRCLRDPETTDDARKLLISLRGRRDLRASIGDDIDEILRASDGGATTSPSEPSLTPIPSSRPVAIRGRLLGLLVGAILGGVGGVLEVTGTGEGIRVGDVFVPYSIVSPLYFGTWGAIAGFISGTHPRLVALALVGALLSSVIAGALAGSPASGAAFGALVGALAGLALKRRLRWA